ncbi:MAG TPA: methyltransferase, partial [Asanoa sp.]|nr:methyltransferase [Asanoa sp.]
MSNIGWYGALVALEFGLAAATAVALLWIKAPYGRYQRAGWGPTVSGRVGWVVMESPAVVVFTAVFVTGAHRTDLVALVLLAMWLCHYVYRAFVYPALMRPGSRMPLLVMALAMAFNVLNATVNAWWVADLGGYAESWLADPRFLAGAVLFFAGLVVHARSDGTLRRLRPPGETGYRIPHGGAFRWVSSPNYTGEIVQWLGWALATWSPAGLAFAVYTTANLAPRAIDHHAWYRERFP